MIRNFQSLLLGCLTAISVLGCGGEDSEAPPPASGLNFAQVTREVINTKNCSGPLCHTGNAAGFMLGTNDQLYAQLVGVKATGPGCETSGMDRIVPYDPDSSLLYLKISMPVPPCGDPMPLTPLDAAQIDLVRSWIEAGAPRN